MKEIVIGANEEGKKLDRFLDAYLKNASKGFIYKMLRKKNITLNNKKADGGEILSSGDVIKIFFSDETFDKFKGSGGGDESFKGAMKAIGDLDIIYEDDNILLINKRAGVLSQKADQDDLTLNEYLLDYLSEKGEVTSESLSTYRPSICNRLDRNTSGIVICAKSLLGARTMNSLIKDRKVDKYYQTIVSGRLSESLVLKGYLNKDERSNKVSVQKKAPSDGSHSYIETWYRPLRYLDKQDLTLLEVKLITGKPHQIRAHLSSIGHPIVGDIKYGGQKIRGQNSQILHCYKVSFPEIEDKNMNYLSGREFTADLPAVFESFLKEV